MKSFLKKIFARENHLFHRFQNWFKQDTLILVSFGNRDVPGLFLVYAHLKYHFGLKVKIRSSLFQRFYVFWYRPTVLVNVNIDNPSADVYSEAGALGIARIMSPTEVFANAEGSEANLISKYLTPELVEGIFLPGEGLRDMFINHGKIVESQAMVVGYPTLDWGSRQWRRYLIPRKEFCVRRRIDPDKKIIFFTSSFCMADFSYENWETEYYNWNLSRAQAKDQIEGSVSMRLKTIDFFSELLAAHPDWHLLIRRHPFEKADIYEARLGNNPQVTAVHDDQLYDLLNVCDALVHWNSTTSLQAWTFSLPTVLLWYPESKAFPMSINEDKSRANFIVTNYAELEKSLRHALSFEQLPKEQLDARERYTKKWFGPLDGQASLRAAEAAIELYEKNKQVDIGFQFTPYDLVKGIHELIPYYWYYWLLRLYIAFGKSIPAWLLRKKSAFDNFSLLMWSARFEDPISRKVKQGSE